MHELAAEVFRARSSSSSDDRDVLVDASGGRPRASTRSCASAAQRPGVDRLGWQPVAAASGLESSARPTGAAGARANRPELDAEVDEPRCGGTRRGWR